LYRSVSSTYGIISLGSGYRYRADGDEIVIQAEIMDCTHIPAALPGICISFKAITAILTIRVISGMIDTDSR
jgi:hypothetical protein